MKRSPDFKPVFRAQFFAANPTTLRRRQGYGGHSKDTKGFWRSRITALRYFY